MPPICSVFYSNATNYNINCIVTRNNLFVNMIDINNALGYHTPKYLLKYYCDNITQKYKDFINFNDLLSFERRMRKANTTQLINELRTYSSSSISSSINNDEMVHLLKHLERHMRNPNNHVHRANIIRILATTINSNN